MQIYFTAQKFKGIPQIIEKDKCDDLRWFNINNLPNYMIERIRYAIEDIESGIIYANYSDEDFNIINV